jgi:hypothetical protein
MPTRAAAAVIVTMRRCMSRGVVEGEGFRGVLGEVSLKDLRLRKGSGVRREGQP